MTTPRAGCRGDTRVWSISLLSPGLLELELQFLGLGTEVGSGPDSVLPFPHPRLAQSLLALFASSLAISLVFAIIPLCHNVVVLAVVMAVAGLAMGCIDTISNMQLVKIYQKDSAIFLQVRAGPSPHPRAGLGWNLGGIPSQKRSGWWRYHPWRCLRTAWLWHCGALTPPGEV